MEEILNSEYVVEISEYIDQVLTERPDKRKKKVYQNWKDEVNKLINHCNKKANFQIYSLVK